MTEDQHELPQDEITGPQILIPKKDIILDSQILSSWMACKRLTDFRFNHNFVPISGKGNAIEAGSIVHEIQKTYYQLKRDGKNRAESIDAALKAGNTYWLNETVNVPAESVKADKEAGIHAAIGWDHIQKTMIDYFLFYNNEHWIPILVEQVQGQIIYEDDEIRVLWKAKFDLTVDTNQGIYPVDHKTMSQRRDTLSLNNQFMGQCVLQKSNSMIVNKIGWQTSLKPNEKFIRSVMNYSTDRLKEWVDLVGFYGKEIINFTEANYFPPNFTHCDKYSGCMFKEVCSSDRNMREQEIKFKFVVGEPWEPLDE